MSGWFSQPGERYLALICATIFLTACVVMNPMMTRTWTFRVGPSSAGVCPGEPNAPGGEDPWGGCWPGAFNTGVPDAIVPSLTTYTGSCTITTPDVVFDRKIINCPDQFRLLSPGIVITNSIINGYVFSDATFLSGAYTITDSEVHQGTVPGTNVTTGIAEARFTATRVEITGGTRGSFCNLNCTIQDSWIHGQLTDTRGIDHESGLRIDNGFNVTHNYITCDATPVEPDAGCSAAISGYGDFGVVQNNTIYRNIIDGGPAGSMAYCAYGGSTQGKPFPDAHDIKYIDNIFKRGPSGQCGIFGPVTSFDVTAPGNEWTNNVWDDDGTPVPPTM